MEAAAFAKKIMFYERCDECQADACEDCEDDLCECVLCGRPSLCPACIDPYNHDCKSMYEKDEEE